MVVNTETLEQRAERLFKDNPRMQELWLAAVAIVRKSKRGWILDKQIQRNAQTA